MALNDLMQMEIEQFEFVDHKSLLPFNYQIVSNIERQLKLRKIMPGEYLPSIRWLAAVNQINPSTVARSYKILIKKKLIKADATRGYRAIG